MLTHVVQSGESLWSIVNKYGLNPVATAINKITVANKLWRSPYILPGQKLSIPLDGLYYRVRQGDTLWGISRKFNIPMDEIISSNNIVNPSQISIGQIIYFPKKAFEPNKYLIYIDPGHQAKPNFDLEPIAPGSSIRKQKVSAGTQGVTTGKPEYVLNLEVALKVQEILKLMGYNVMLTRTIHDVNISNSERAIMANKGGADISVRIHADGSQSRDKSGISVLYPAEDSPNTDAAKYNKSKWLAQLLLNNLIKSTNANSLGIVPRDDTTGFNWSEIPVALVEMGFMTNPQEDMRMSNNMYQYMLAEGIAEGINDYFLSGGPTQHA